MKTRVCVRCSVEKPKDEFYTSPSGQMSYCKECFNTYCKERWIKTKRRAVAYLGGKCITCGYSGHMASLVFHHRDPLTKSYSWTRLRLRKWSEIEHELDKCDLLCANCHNVVHANYAA